MLLVSSTRTHFLRLDLLPLAMPAHAGWHSYRIMVGLADRSTAEILEASEDAPLFLDARVTPEIPSLCTGISRVVQEGGHFIFEPIDERDFVLEVQSDQGHLSLRLDAADRPFDPLMGWPSGLPVEPAALLAFADGLLLEFDQLRRSEARPG
jgi:hypothetical protein